MANSVLISSPVFLEGDGRLTVEGDLCIITVPPTAFRDAPDPQVFMYIAIVSLRAPCLDSSATVAQRSLVMVKTISPIYFIIASISATVLGVSRLKLSGPFSVMRMSSSMRIPICQNCSGTPSAGLT
ncbi:MAG: hypothetical protein K0R08_135 [Solimicrobium sp.]|nr:hypothetical protein [Solimicrobium sp.]